MRILITRVTTLVIVGMFCLAGTGCRPAEPPPDVLKNQRDALVKARALDGQMQQLAKERMEAVNEAQK